MTQRGIFSYALIFLFALWCLQTFQKDIAQINFQAVWQGRYVVLLGLALSLLNYGLRLLRWNYFLRCLGYRLPADFSCLAYIAGFAFTLSPGKLGELARCHYFLKADVPTSRTVAAFFVERFLDLLAIVALATLGVGASYKNLIIVTAAVIFLALALLALAPWRKIAAIIDRSSLPQLLKKVTNDLTHMLLSAQALLQIKRLFFSFALTIAAWGAEGVGLVVLSAITPATALDLAAGVSIYSVAILIGALSFLPGGLGSTEAVMVALLNGHGFNMADAILLTLLCRVLTLWFAVLLGLIALVALQRKPIIRPYPQ